MGNAIYLHGRKQACRSYGVIDEIALQNPDIQNLELNDMEAICYERIGGCRPFAGLPELAKLYEYYVFVVMAFLRDLWSREEANRYMEAKSKFDPCAPELPFSLHSRGWRDSNCQQQESAAMDDWRRTLGAAEWTIDDLCPDWKNNLDLTATVRRFERVSLNDERINAIQDLCDCLWSSPPTIIDEFLKIAEILCSEGDCCFRSWRRFGWAIPFESAFPMVHGLSNATTFDILPIYFQRPIFRLFPSDEPIRSSEFHLKRRLYCYDKAFGSAQALLVELQVLAVLADIQKGKFAAGIQDYAHAYKLPESPFVNEFERVCPLDAGETILSKFHSRICVGKEKLPSNTTIGTLAWYCEAARRNNLMFSGGR